MADMATQSFVGNATRGMSLVALHNGGGVGISKSVNGGFGLVLDGSTRVDHIIDSAMEWDVMVGVTRRAWARNTNAVTACRDMQDGGDSGSEFLMPEIADEGFWN
jgi:urocanate hydratase